MPSLGFGTLFTYKLGKAEIDRLIAIVDREVGKFVRRKLPAPIIVSNAAKKFSDGAHL